MKKILLIVLMIGISAVAFAEGKVTQIIRKIDKQMEMTSDISARVNLTQQKPEQGTKLTKMVYYRRDSDDSFLILMTDPEVEKGNGYLKQGDNFWMYRRNTRTFQHINRDESIGGSNASADDFESRKYEDLYKPEVNSANQEVYAEEMLGKVPVYKFKLTNRVQDVKYPMVVFWVTRDTYLPLKEQSYSLAGTLMETGYYLKYTQIDGKDVMTQGMFIDEFEKGNKTMVEISSISTQKLDNSIFTKAYLENLSK